MPLTFTLIIWPPSYPLFSPTEYFHHSCHFPLPKPNIIQLLIPSRPFVKEGLSVWRLLISGGHFLDLYERVWKWERKQREKWERKQRVWEKNFSKEVKIESSNSRPSDFLEYCIFSSGSNFSKFLHVFMKIKPMIFSFYCSYFLVWIGLL